MKSLQQRIVAKRAQRGFTTEPLEVFTLLQEEVGEIAGELKKTWSPNYDTFDPEKLGEEIADCLALLAALADRFDIDMEEALERMFFEKDARRKWRSAP